MKPYPFLALLFWAGFCPAQPPFRTGVNFPFFRPDLVSIDHYLSLMEQSGAGAIRQMTFADVHWRQVEPADNQWNFTRSDSTFFNGYGLTPIGTLYSIMGNDTVGLQTPWLACSNPFQCYWDPAGDSVFAKDYVLATVSRYKHATRYWELANEIEHALPPPGLPPGMASKRDFLRYNYQWIKAADPSAQVLLPGLVGTCCTYPMSLSFNWLRSLLAAGGGAFFDIMNYHDYNAWWTLPAHFDSIRAILQQYQLNKPIWVTETSVSSFNTSPITPAYASPDEQAADVWRRYCLLWAKGAEVVLWHTGWSNSDLNGWGEFGLLNVQGRKKKSFHAYRLLNERISAFNSVHMEQQGQVTDDNTSGGEGLWAVRFVINGRNKWVLWSPDRRPYRLQGIQTQRIAVTTTVPVALLNNGDSAVFQVQTYDVVQGEHPFADLTQTPILVEETGSMAVSEPPQAVSGLRLSPNPAQDFAILHYTLARPSGVRLAVYDSLGQLMHSEIGHGPLVGEQQGILSLASWPAGLYYLQLWTDAGTGTSGVLLKK